MEGNTPADRDCLSHPSGTPANDQGGFSRDMATEAADLFRVLSDPTRVLIVLALAAAGELCVTDLAGAVGMTAPAVCHHLQILRHLGLVRSSRKGRNVYYRVDQSRFQQRLYGSLGRMRIAGGADSSQRDRPIRIGSTFPLTGFAAPDGLEQKRAMTVAIEQWNSRGGVQGRLIEHVYLDVGDMSPKRMVSTFQSLIQDHHVDAIVNGYLLYTGKEYELVANSGIPYVHSNTSSISQKLYSTDPERFWMCFQVDPSERLYALGFIRFIQFLERSGAFRARKKEIAIIAGSDPYSETIAITLRQTIKRIGWGISIFEKVKSPCDRWARILRRISVEQPDVVFLSDIVLEDNVTFVSDFLENPIPALLYGQYSPTLREYVDSLGPSAEGTITSTVNGVLPGELGDQYRTTYEQRWGVAPGASIGGIVFDTTNLYLTAVALAGGSEDRRRVCDLLQGLWVRGTTGVCHFTRERVAPSFPTETLDPSAGVPHLFFQVQEGRQRILYPPPYVETQFVLPPWFQA
ncbi:MAG: metalloregulator ArsR/SmtB family transcription factor [Thermoleophilia bacterium]|nr:metalloregulator ArsR/SmtB family transcription factor [Thermoleophilia bacterium]